jgi:endoglucanase
MKKASPKATFYVKSFFLLLLAATASPLSSSSQGYLKTANGLIVNEKGETVLLRGMGLGGWMLQEGYMLRFGSEGQQYRIRERISNVIGEQRTAEFYDAWLANHTTKADIDSMKAWGFNSVRLPMHFNLYTLPADREPVAGKDTWLEKGFAMTDSLLAWCKANRMYLILDLHAAPGGQGNDLNISDRDPSKPSLWQSEENQRKTVALWRKLAERYVNEPWIGAYDLINEPNWGFGDLERDKNGLQEKENKPLRELLIRITRAIREVDGKHMVIIEGNGWGNNYNGIFPLWDNNLTLSFHKYWNFNDQGSINQFLELRKQHNVPLWLGETGENSNVWFTQAIRLAEANDIGWSWWPLKKLGFNNPLEVKAPEGYDRLLAYWTGGKAAKPAAENAYRVLMQLAANTNIRNCIPHRDVVDAMFRQVYSAASKPFSASQKMSLMAVDYDLGRNGVAYWDKDTADYHISTNSDWGQWNKGRTYRNDGVDIRQDAKAGFYVSDIEDGEWLQYSFNVRENGTYALRVKAAAASPGGLLSVIHHAKTLPPVNVPATGDALLFKEFSVKGLTLKKGWNTIRVKADKGGFNLQSLSLQKN